MSSCEEYRELVSALLDGELSGAQQDEILEHLAACPDCRQYREDLTAIRRLLDWEEAQPPEGFAESVMARAAETPQEKPVGKALPFPRWKRWAALAACCAVAALGVWSFWGWNGAGMGQKAADVCVTADAAPQALPEDECAPLPEPAPALASPPAAPAVRAYTEDAAPAGAGDEADNAERKEELEYADTPLLMPAESPAPGLERSGGITAGGEAAQAWVEEHLGLAWESGRRYPLTEEEFAGLLAELESAGEDFAREEGEGYWLTAE